MIISIINCIVFGMCIALLESIAIITNTSYKEVSVWINIYLQGLIIALSSLFVLNGAMKTSENRNVKTTCATIYVILNFLVYIAILGHYGFNFTEAFDKCYNELMYVSRCFAQHTLNPTEDDWYSNGAQFNTKLFYVDINVFFFVYTFIATIFVNCCIGKKLKKVKVNLDLIASK